MISYFILYFNPTWAPFLLRVVLGGLLVAHGRRKIGTGFAEFAKWLESLKFKPGTFWASIVVVVECVGGLFLVVGLFTHIVAVAVAIEFLIIFVRLRLMMEAPVADSKGWERDLLFFAIAVSLLFTGPGAHSLDEILHLIWL